MLGDVRLTVCCIEMCCDESSEHGVVMWETDYLLELLFLFNDTATTEIYTRSLVGSVRCV